jgi:NADH-quinone oxidoreductase subunit M
MILGIIWLYLYIGELNIQILQYIILSKEHQLILWFLFFIAFAVKVPMYPVHSWLPEAHVEAPTGGSIILAGVLLKLGLYGMLRVLIVLFPIANIYYTPLVITLSFISVIFISIIILQQIDLKKIIAYSSIAHMNFAVIGIFSNNIYGIEGSIFTMLSHGLISSMLFFCIGVLYDRYGERNLLYYSNVVQIMPFFSFFFFFSIIANLGMPGTSSFIGEFLLLLSLSFKSIFLLFIMSSTLFLTTIYCIWLFNRICFGYMSKKYIIIYKDLTKFESLILIIFTILILFFGLYPNCILNLFHDFIYFNMYKQILYIPKNL